MSRARHIAEQVPSSVRALERLLADHGIAVSEWRPPAKTVRHLLREIERREARLLPDGDLLLRQIRVAAVRIRFETGRGTPLVLLEDRQTFRDGTERRRVLDASIGEKALAGERLKAAARRAVSEELGLSIPYAALEPVGMKSQRSPSKSYPGLRTEAKIGYFELALPAALYAPEGYVERQPDKTSHFIWSRSPAPWS